MRIAMLVFLNLALLPGFSYAQVGELPPGFQRISGQYVDVITDMPLDDKLNELPKVFDAAVPQWCKIFDVDISDVADWHVEAFMMLDKRRFQTAGLIPSHLPDFPYGFQYGDQVWVSEQPSPYYRRHLLLHEGTHWFMHRKFGRSGPPWLMEGMAEWLGTHRWDGNTLTMGIIPKTKDEVPYWGRITLIQRQLEAGVAPSLEAILRYGDRAHQQVEAYAWSWAAVVFLKNHPRTKDIFAVGLTRPMRSDHALSRWIFERLRNQWPQLRQDWNATLTELEYGYDPRQGMMALSVAPEPLGAEPAHFQIRADQSWQASGILVRGPAKITVSATGDYSVASEPRPWACTPAGVTLEYYRGEPLGKLLMSVGAPIPREPEFSEPLSTIAIGSGGEFNLDGSGELHFRVNETNGGLADNSGQLTITVRQ